jgi:hypothetical protein
MNLLQSQNILLVVLKTYGFFPINFGGKFKKYKSHLYNFVVSISLIVTFTVVSVSQVESILIHTTEKESALGHLAALVEVFSPILCFAIIKLHLLVNSEAKEMYFAKLEDLEITVRSHHVKNTQMDKIIEDMRKSTFRQEILVLAFYILIHIGFGYVAITDNILLYHFNGCLFDTLNDFYIQILIFLKMNMDFARRLQAHLNQVLLNLQKSDRHFNVEDFIRINRKTKQFLSAFNEAFGFVFLMTFVNFYGSMIPEIYKNILTLAQSDSNISINSLVYSIFGFIWVSFSYYHLGRFAFECDKFKDEVDFCVIII